LPAGRSAAPVVPQISRGPAANSPPIGLAKARPRGTAVALASVNEIATVGVKAIASVKEIAVGIATVIAMLRPIAAASAATTDFRFNERLCSSL
jgi:hypothetical protein